MKKKSKKIKTNKLKKHYQFVIIGAGPAGLQLGYYLQKNKEDYVILERNKKAGSFFEKYPIHRKLISVNKRHVESDPGIDINEFAYRHDWNSLLCDNPDLRLKNYSRDYYPQAECLVKYLNDFSSFYHLNIYYQADVTLIKKNKDKDGYFQIDLLSGQFISAQFVIVCTGVSKNYIPNIIGIEHTTHYGDLSSDPSEFEDQRVCIIGKGNSGLEVANSITNVAKYICLISHNSPKFAWESHFVGDTRAVNNDFYDTYQLKSMAFTADLCNISITKLENGKYFIKESNQYIFDRVINCAGFSFDYSIFDKSIQPEILHDKLPKINWNFESTNTKNLFFCGTITQSLDYKKNTMGFIHGFRYSAEFIYNVMTNKTPNSLLNYSILPGKCITIPRDISQLTLYLTKEITENSCIWQCFQYWCLVIIIDTDGFRIYRNIPIGYIREHSDLLRDYDILIVTLEYGFQEDDNVFEIFPGFYPFHGFLSKFIHPIFRYYPKLNQTLNTDDTTNTNNTNNSNRFQSQNKLFLCVCGRWENKDFMTTHTICHECINKGFCICGEHESVDFLQKNKGRCQKCVCGLKPTKVPYQINLSTLRLMANVTNATKKLSSQYCYEFHLMEDILGRYHSINEISQKELQRQIQCVNYTTPSKILCYKDYNTVLYRYLDTILNNVRIDISSELFLTKMARFNKPSRENIYFFQRFFLTINLIECDLNDKKLFSYQPDHDNKILQNNSKRSLMLSVMKKHIMELTKISDLHTVT